MLRQREFRVFYTGYATSLLGTGMSGLALTFAVLSLGGGGTALGLVMAARIVPVVIMLLVGGVAADRFGGRRTMLATDAVRGLAMAALAVCFLGHPGLATLLILAAVEGFAEGAFSPALSGLIPRITAEATLGDANALLSSTSAAASIAGPALAGVVTAFAGPSAVLGADAASYLVSLVMLLHLGQVARTATDGPLPQPGAPTAEAPPGKAAHVNLHADTDTNPHPHPHPDPDPDTNTDTTTDEPAESPNRHAAPTPPAPSTPPTPPAPLAPPAPPAESFLTQLREGWSIFRARPYIWVTSVQMGLFNLLVWAPFLVLGPVLADQRLGGAESWGAVMSLYGAGAILGGLAALGRTPRRPLMLAVIATIGWGLPGAALATRLPLPWICAATFAAGIGSAVVGTYFSLTGQTRVPQAARARVSAFGTFGAFVLGPLGLAAAGPVGSAIGIDRLLGLGALYQLTATAVVLCVPAVRARPPEPGTEQYLRERGEWPDRTEQLTTDASISAETSDSADTPNSTDATHHIPHHLPQG